MVRLNEERIFSLILNSLTINNILNIIILLILAGISISALTNTGLFARANDAKIASKIGEIEEFATLKVYELYTENINNMDAVNDATITTALKAELIAKGYEIKDVNTTSETVNGLKIQDSTGQNNFDSISLLQQKDTTIKVSLDTTSQLISSKTYVKIYNNWYELIIKDKTVKISKEKYEEPVETGNAYEIKLKPPTSGVIMTAGETQIKSETTITPGALITVKAGNDIGTFIFTVKETTNSVTKNVNVNVTADPAYATDLTIAVEGDAAEIAPGETLQLVATKTPSTSTDIVSWKIKSENATIDDTGLVTANSDAEVGSTIIVSATCDRKDETTSTVGEKTLNITVKAKGESVGDIVDGESKVGYYADIDGDGDADGIIYADLAVGGTGTYDIPIVEDTKEYRIISSYDSEKDPFNTKKPVISLSENDENDGKEERFYIMALNDMEGTTDGTFYWYYNAVDYSGDTPVGLMYDYMDATSKDFGTGMSNTNNILLRWNVELWGSQYKCDVWNYVGEKVNDGWFIPSVGEMYWFKEMICLNDYYAGNLLDGYYCCSSLYNEMLSYCLDLTNNYGLNGDFEVSACTRVRLSMKY